MDRFLRLVRVTVRLAAAIAGLAVLWLVDVREEGGALLLVPGLVVVAAALLPTGVARRVVVGTGVSLAATVAIGTVTRTRDIDLFSHGLAETAALVFLMAQATRSLPHRRAVVLVPAAAVALPAMLLRDVIGDVDPVTVMALLGCVSLPVLVGLSLRFGDELRARAADQARTEDRLALSRDVHDTVAHTVTGIVMRAQAAQLRAGQGEAALLDALADIDREGTRALVEMRRVVSLLRRGDRPVTALDPVESLRELARGSSGPGLDVHLEVDPGVGDLDLADPTAAALHRVVQESLTNVRRHAPAARQVKVTVGRASGRLTVAVDDDGPPPPPSTDPGYGLRGLAERVIGLGGEFSAGPGPAGGWRVAAALPMGAP